MATRRPRPGARGGPTTSHRVGDEIRVKISELLRKDMRDQRLAGVHLTRVEMTRDLSLARIYWRPTPGEAPVEAASDALERAAGFLRGRLGKSMRLRSVPELRFALDELPGEASRIESLMASLTSMRATPAEGRDETDEAGGREGSVASDDSDE